MRYAREGVQLERSTLFGWVGDRRGTARSIGLSIRRHFMAATKLHANDRRCPGKETTRIRRLWAYSRVDEHHTTAVWLGYTSNRQGVHPQEYRDVFIA